MYVVVGVGVGGWVCISGYLSCARLSLHQMFNTYTGKWLTDDLFRSGFCFNSSTTNAHEFMYRVPQATDISVYRDYINSLPYVDQPGVFGLHVNADLTFRLQESSSMLETIQVHQMQYIICNAFSSFSSLLFLRGCNISASTSICLT